MNTTDHRRGPCASDPGAWLSELAQILDFSAEYWLQGASPPIEEVISNPDWRGGLVSAGLLPRELGTGVPPVSEPASHEADRRELTVIPGDRFVPPTEAGQLPKGARKKLTGEDHPAAICAVVYQAAGYDLAPFGDRPPDHLGHQLRFLAALCRREGTALQEGREEAARSVRTWREGFVKDHTPWWAEFGGKVAEGGRTTQVKVMAGLLEGLHRALAGSV